MPVCVGELGHYEIAVKARSNIGGILPIHSRRFCANVEQGGTDVASDGVVVKKRKKLKGRREVAKWLKVFRWKKKKEYERMTPEERILFKLTKVDKA